MGSMCIDLTGCIYNSVSTYGSPNRVVRLETPSVNLIFSVHKYGFADLLY